LGGFNSVSRTSTYKSTAGMDIDLPHDMEEYFRIHPLPLPQPLPQMPSLIPASYYTPGAGNRRDHTYTSDYPYGYFDYRNIDQYTGLSDLYYSGQLNNATRIGKGTGSTLDFLLGGVIDYPKPAPGTGSAFVWTRQGVGVTGEPHLAALAATPSLSGTARRRGDATTVGNPGSSGPTTSGNP